MIPAAVADPPAAVVDGRRLLLVDVTTADLLAGTKQTCCPHCTSGLLIVLPDREQLYGMLTIAGGAAAEGLRLCGRERMMFELLYAQQGAWLDRHALFELVWGDPSGYGNKAGWGSSSDPLHTLRVTVLRLRQKLAGTCWRIECWEKVGYRLVRQDTP